MQTNIWLAAGIFILFLLGSTAIDLTLKRIARHYDANANEAFRLLANSQRTVLIFIGLILALSKLGFNVSALVAGLGLTGFALGFALKDAISNLVAGIMIVIYQPVELGNQIEVANTKGKVVDLNLRYLTLESDGLTHLIPNSLLLSNKVTIHQK
ncbi:mechanosensitive ion channel family protein [Persicirhabdus sediminis]|uniref:Mechanosensitive ion channel n=1 Tax=Persicirhabdus sediminis TaxID=454144 RepID=A0A8J7MED5_9BACT|nr:mechanosensitive ion channel domain-containing protein [Persicirhabdus sediminis]MBK1791852.1 mechanosensitive ion channel [Persicirhabdus sediminis]